MADIKVLLPQIETANATNKLSVEVGAATADTVLTTIGTEPIKVADAMANKNNSMYIVINVLAEGKLTVVAGDEYPNAILGDYTTAQLAKGVNVIQLEDISRFENRDNSIVLKGDGTLDGNLFVIGKRVGVDTVANQNARDDAANRTLHKTDYAG